MQPCDPRTERCYRKKPMAVRAFQMTLENMRDRSVWPDHLLDALEKDKIQSGALIPVRSSDGLIVRYEIQTLEGPHIVYPDAWIIQGPEGEIWAVKDSIFRKTYEEIPRD